LLSLVVRRYKLEQHCKMSEGIDALQLKEEDVTKFLTSGSHLGAQNVDTLCADYVYKRKSDGIHIINLKKTWEKLILAARIIAGIENPADVCVISARPFGTRAVLKFAHHTGATPIAGRFTPGTFTNQIQKAFREPRLLISTDPQFDHQAITEASYVNIPVIALCNTDSPLKFVDCAIPCNNKGVQAIGTMWWMLAREVLYLRGIISRQTPWDVMPDLYFYREPEDIEKEELAAQAQAKPEEAPYQQQDWNAGTIEPQAGDWTDPAATTGATADWGAEPVGNLTTDWAAEPMTKTDDWGAPGVATGNWDSGEAAGTTADWGASNPDGEWS